MTRAQPICRTCWWDEHTQATRWPLVAKAERKAETCCRCGEDTDEGIWIWTSPATTRFPS